MLLSTAANQIYLKNIQQKYIAAPTLSNSPSYTIYHDCIPVNALHMFTYPPNHEVLTDKLSGLLFGPLRGGAGEWPRTV